MWVNIPFTRLVWPRRMVICSGKRSAFQMMILLSTLAVARTTSPGPHARSKTSPLCPLHTVILEYFNMKE